MLINPIIGAIIMKLIEVTIRDKTNINDVNAGNSAPILLNISSNVGTIKIKRARLMVTAKTRIATG